MSSFAESFFGGVFIEMFIASILYGTTALQTFIYFQSSQVDRLFLRAMVGAICMLETLHTWFCIEFVYNYTIVHFGDAGYMLEIDWTLGLTVITEVLISSLVQLFYIRRVWILSDKNKIVTGVLGIVWLARFGFGIGTCILCYKFKTWVELRAHIPILVTLGGGLGAAAFVDVMAALALSYYLMRGRNERPKSSQSTVNMIMMYAVNTGALTSLASLVGFFLFVTNTGDLAFSGVLEIQGKLYSNSFLGSLNARDHIRSKSETISTFPASFETSTGTGLRFNSTTPRVEVFRSTVTTTDTAKHDDADIERDSASNYGVQKFGMQDYAMQNIKGSDFP